VRRRGLIAALLLLAGCASRDAGRVAVGPDAPLQGSDAPLQGWRAVATENDRGRLRDWRRAWVEALRSAYAGGYNTDVAREGVLLFPDAAQANASLPDGTYDCRVIKVGAREKGNLDYVAYPRFDCRVERRDGVQHLIKLTGSQRPVGQIYPDTGTRSVFLGTLMLGDERMAMRYGQDATRDVAGVVERIGVRRWRLVLPYPRFESLVDVVELVPKT